MRRVSLAILVVGLSVLGSGQGPAEPKFNQKKHA